MLQQRGQHRAHRRAAAAAADRGRLPRQFAFCAGLRGPEHQLGPEQVERRRRGVGAEQAEVDPAGARLQPGARGQQGRACHAGAVDRHILAAEHEQVAMAALVQRVPLLAWWTAGRLAGREPGVGCRAGGIDAEPVEPDLPGGVASVGREQSGLEREQAQRVARPARQQLEGVAPAAAVGVESAGQVHAQNGRAGLLQRPHPVRHDAGFESAAAQSQQRVDPEVECLGWRIAEGDAGAARLLQREAGVVGQAVFLAMPADEDSGSRQLPLQQGSRQQAVAAVVARAAGDPDHARVRVEGARERGDGSSGALHQLVRWQPGQRGLFEPAAAGAAVQRQVAGQGGGEYRLHETV